MSVDSLAIAELDRLTQRVEAAREAAGPQADPYQRAAFDGMLGYLVWMKRCHETGELPPRGQRYGYIARLVVESDPATLPPDLGGDLIDAEARFRKYER